MRGLTVTLVERPVWISEWMANCERELKVNNKTKKQQKKNATLNIRKILFHVIAILKFHWQWDKLVYICNKRLWTFCLRSAADTLEINWWDTCRRWSQYLTFSFFLSFFLLFWSLNTWVANTLFSTNVGMESDRGVFPNRTFIYQFFMSYIFIIVHWSAPPPSETPQIWILHGNYARFFGCGCRRRDFSR